MLHRLRRVLTVLLVLASTATGLYLHAEERPPSEGARVKAQQEFRKVRREEYLKGLEQREQYHNEMGQQMRALRQACAGEDREACKKAKEQEKALRERHRERRQQRQENFREKTEDFRQKMGDGPTEVEKQHRQLKETFKRQEMELPVPAQ